MRKPVASLMSGIVLLAAVVVPPLGMAFGASSMAAGLLLVVGLYLKLFAALCAVHKPRQRLGKVVVFVIVVLIIVAIQGIISFMLNDKFNISRFSQTYGFLFIFILGASSLTILALGLPLYMADFAVKFVFYVLLLCGFAPILGYRAFGNPSAVVFFNENSHYALSFGPFLLYMVVLSNLKKKLLFIILGFFIALSLQSLTLLVVLIAIVFLTLRLKKLLLFAIITITVFLFTFIDYIDVGYYSSRIDFSDTNTNLSTLSFMHGWERAYMNFKDYNGIGIGFQQLGFLGSEGETMQILKEMGSENLNLLDGNTVASKLLSEFGIFALVVLLAYFVYFAKSAKWLHKVSVIGGKTVDYKKVFFLSCFLMFFIDLFIRGTGYFSSSGFLFIASIVWFVLHPVSWAPSQEHLSNDCFALPHSSTAFE